MIINEFNKTKFMAEYWQQKPCVIRNFIKDFVDPIDENELAGLAQESDVESRIISFNNPEWSVETGPFEDFESVCKGAWTLLVQSVDRHIPEVEALAEVIDFIPKWRMDDVMISFSQVDAGVGPHIDEYDVFIIQGKGTRRWQVGLPNQYETVTPHPKLKQITGFEPTIDEVLAAGDAIYIPPKHPHNGRALSPCMNYSIGFRAPSNLELLNQIVDETALEQQIEVITRYQDQLHKTAYLSQLQTSSKQQAFNYCVHSNDINKMKSHMIALIQSEQANNAIIASLSRQHLNLEALPCEEQYSQTTLEENLSAYDCTIYRELGLKPLFAAQQNSAQFEFFIEGESFSVSQELKESLIYMFNCAEVDLNSLLNETATPYKNELLRLICELVNNGYYVLEQA